MAVLYLGRYVVYRAHFEDDDGTRCLALREVLYQWRSLRAAQHFFATYPVGQKSTFCGRQCLCEVRISLIPEGVALWHGPCIGDQPRTAGAVRPERGR